MLYIYMYILKLVRFTSCFLLTTPRWRMGYAYKPKIHPDMSSFSYHFCKECVQPTIFWTPVPRIHEARAMRWCSRSLGTRWLPRIGSLEVAQPLGTLEMQPRSPFLEWFGFLMCCGHAVRHYVVNSGDFPHWKWKATQKNLCDRAAIS